jgi:hypothetical protein
MLIFDENTHAILVESITTPMTTEYFWVLNLEIMDFTLTPLIVLEEVVGPTIVLEIHGFRFKLPATWCTLVFAEETMQLDVVENGDLAGKDFTAMISGPNTTIPLPGHVKLIDYILEDYNYVPSLSKSQMLCHPIAPDLWVNVAPSDPYNKYLKDLVVGNITS